MQALAQPINPLYTSPHGRGRTWSMGRTAESQQVAREPTFAESCLHMSKEGKAAFGILFPPEKKDPEASGARKVQRRTRFLFLNAFCELNLILVLTPLGEKLLYRLRRS